MDAFEVASIANTIASNNVRILKLLVAVPGTYNPLDLNVGLIQAAKLGHVESVKCLLECGADKHFVSPALTTSLHTAIQNNKPDVVKLLLNTGCDANFKGDSYLSPLLLAAKLGYTGIIDILISHNAKIESRDSQGNTPLILSAINGQYLAMKALINAGCDINARNKEGCTALHYACHKAQGYQILLEAGANPDITDKDNITPLLMAATEGFDNVVNSLVAAKCNVNIKNKSVERTALHILAYKGHANCINSLIYGNAEIDACDSFNRTPLWYAIKNKNVEVVRLLLKAYSHVDTFKCASKMFGDDCPTRLAFQNKLFDVVKFFIITGYDHCHMRDCLKDIEFADWLNCQDDSSHWLSYAAGAQSLKYLCRKSIRHHLGTSIYHHLHFLPIPEMIKEYLLLEELHYH